MKHLKTFENFGDKDQDLGRFSDVDADEQDWLKEINPNNDGFEDEDDEFGNEMEDEDSEMEDDMEDEMEDEMGEEPVRRKTWGDEIVEKKKMNAGFKAYLDKKKGKAKKDDKKAEKKDGKKGLTAGQKKLPEAMQKAILKKQK